MKIAEILIDNAEKKYKYLLGSIEAKVDDKVVVESGDMLSLGVVSSIIDGNEKSNHKKVIRLATKDDISLIEKLNKEKQTYINTAQEYADKAKLKMRIKDVSFSVDKITIKIIYTAPDRVDFRQYVKDIGKKFKRKISMHQISSRDLASKICGIGICGRELCCCKVLKKTPSVKITALKNQGISIASSNNEGACGKLRCCYNYENDTYTKLKEEMPGTGQIVEYKNKSYKITSINYFTGDVKLIDKQRDTLDVKVNDLKWSKS